MQISSTRQELMNALAAVQGIAQTSLSNPIIENVLVQAEKDRIAFTATNLSLSVQASCEGKVKTSGEITIPAKYAYNIMREMPEGDIEISLKNEKIKMTSGSAEVSLNSQPADQFPGIIFDLEGVSMKFPVTEFKTTINRTYFAATAEKSRFELDGVKLDFTEEGLFWISTDGKRLSSVTASVEGIGVNELTALIPAKAMAELNRIIPGEGDVTITVGENKIAFVCTDLKVVSSLLVDNFPPYKQIIPKDYRQRVTLDKNVLAQAVRRASILSHEKTNLVKLIFKPGELTISGERFQVGDTFSTIPMEYKGEDFEAGYKSEFLLEILRVIDTDKITMEWMQPSSPVVIRPYEDETFLHVIMPIKLADAE